MSQIMHSHHASRTIRWLAIAAAAAALAIPAAAASADQPSQTPQLPTARQVAMHQGRLGAYLRSTQTPQFPTARQVAMHEGRLPETLAVPASAVAPPSSGNDYTLPIVLSSVALFVALASIGLVARGARIRRSTQLSS